MDADHEFTVEERLAQVRDAFQARQQRLFLWFSVLAGGLLIVITTAIYAFGMVDPGIGLYILMGAAMISGLTLAILLMRLMSQHRQAIERARGGS